MLTVGIRMSGAALRQRMARLTSAARHRVEVYVAEPRGAVALYHKHGTRTMPARNPFYLEPSTARRVADIIRSGLRSVWSRDVDPRPFFLRAGLKAVEGITRNIAPGGNVGGAARGRHLPAGQAVGSGTPMRALSRRYADRKLAKIGPRPILVATGQMVGGLRVRVVRV